MAMFGWGWLSSVRKSFFTQLQELQEKVPHPHQNGANNYKCDWCDDVWNSKNCYLSRSMEGCENLLYSYRNVKVKNSIDMVVSFDSERCFSSVNCHNSYNPSVYGLVLVPSPPVILAFDFKYKVGLTLSLDHA